MSESAESMRNQTHDPSGLVWVAHNGTDAVAVPNAVYVGKETNDRDVYIARASYDGCLFIGKFVPGIGMDFDLDFEEIKPPTFQVLTNPSNEVVQTKWAFAEGRIPPTAVKGGYVHNADRWNYIGRTKCQGNTVVGEVRTCFGGENHLFYSINGSGRESTDFEILLAKKRHE